MFALIAMRSAAEVNPKRHNNIFFGVYSFHVAYTAGVESFVAGWFPIASVVQVCLSTPSKTVGSATARGLGELP